jgi:putative FmdB family regulatory protein
MPTYEYECTKCGYEFERFQNMSDEPLKRCPKCRCKVRRLIGSGAGIIFKGSGFYETDYRSKSYQDAAGKEAKAKKESKSSGSGSKSKSDKSKSTDSKKKSKKSSK